MGQNSKCPPFCRDKIQNSPLCTWSQFEIHSFLLGQYSKVTPFYWVKFRISPLFIGSIFCKRSSLRSQTFLSFGTLYLAYSKLIRTPCIKISEAYENWSYHSFLPILTVKSNVKLSIFALWLSKKWFRFSSLPSMQ